MAYALLAAAQVVGILLVPFGLPGLWIQVVGLAAYGWYTDFVTVGVPALVICVGLAAAAEGVEFWLGGAMTRRYGGSRRGAWGAIGGGIVGAFLGLPIPVIGSVIGSLLGSFAGALAMELSLRSELAPAMRSGWGALLGRLAATAVKCGVGISIAAIALLTALR